MLEGSILSVSCYKFGRIVRKSRKDDGGKSISVRGSESLNEGDDVGNVI